MKSARRKPGAAALALAGLSVVAFVGARAGMPGSGAARPGAVGADPQVLLGRHLVLNHDCGGCHGGGDDPAAPGWLQGEKTPDQAFAIGPCPATPSPEQPCFHTHPRNLTPDNETGLGRFSERQIFNALRYGLRPEDTPDVTITSSTPGQGNFPLHPHYLAPPMPWPGWRHMYDAELRAIAAYLKRGLKPVHNKVTESEGPPDFWAAEYAGGIPALKLGPYPALPFPTVNEQGPEAARAAPRK